jgi:rhamnogalacturonyl hydrolase YesR
LKFETENDLESRLNKSVAMLVSWVENHQYRAYDPGDGQLSPLRRLTFEKLRLKQVLTAVILRTPFNIRPLIGIRPHTSTKGMGYMAWGYVKMYARTADKQFAERARFCLDWLVEHRAPDFKDFCWGNHFDFTTRGGTIPAHSPTIVWSSLIGMSFLEAYHVLGDTKYLEVARSVADWILSLPRERTASGTCLSYVAFKQSSIHNSNMLGGALLAKVGGITKHDQTLEVAKSAMEYSCSRLNKDGSWFYGDGSKYHWVDNFHTAYNLDSLKRYCESTGDRDYDDQLKSAFNYFKKTFFEDSGLPKYYHNAVYPVDIQCAAQAIDTLSFFAEDDPESLPLGRKVAAWTIDNMQDQDGHFYYRDLGWKRIKTPMFHWGQGTTFKALAHMLAVQQKKRVSAAVGTTPAKKTDIVSNECRQN